MPTYDYECGNCKHRFDAFQPITAKPLNKCPKCGRRGLRRLIGSGAGIIFRGPGFFATDYRRGSPAKSEPTGPAAKTPKAGSTNSSD